MNDPSSPRDEAAEQAVLGAVLLEPAAITKALGVVKPEAFYVERNRVIYGTMLDLSARGVKIDPLTVRDELARRGNLDRAGGMEYVAALIDAVPTASHIEDHARIVADKASRRRLIDVARQAIDGAQNGIPFERLRENLTGALADVGNRPQSGETVKWRTLRELLAEPQASSAPVAVVPRIAFRGRTTLFASREKGGKSTLSGAGAAAVTCGAIFLGELTPQGSVLWLVAEEHPHDLAQRAKDFGTNEDHLFVMPCPPPDRLFLDIREAINAVRPVLFVVDTLATSVGGLIDDPHSSTAWTPVMSAFTAIARDFDVAVLLLAHARKSDGSYRDSTAIGAGVDVILEMSTAPDDSSLRVIKAVGRWTMKPFSVRFTGSGFELAGGGEISLDARVLLHIKRDPGQSTRRLRDEVGGRACDVDAAVRGLIIRGAVVEMPGPNRAKLLYAAEDAPAEFPGASRPNSPDAPRDTPESASHECVPALSRNDLAPDAPGGVSHAKTLGGETGHTNGDAWEPPEAAA